MELHGGFHVAPRRPRLRPQHSSMDTEWRLREGLHGGLCKAFMENSMATSAVYICFVLSSNNDTIFRCLVITQM